MNAFDPILNVLGDGKWHSFDEVCVKVDTLNNKQVRLILDFFEIYGSVEWSSGTCTFRLAPMMVRFLEQIKKLEKKESKP